MVKNRLLNLPTLPNPDTLSAELDAELKIDETYQSIGPLAVTLAQQKADRDLSPIQSTAVRAAEDKALEPWLAFTTKR